MVAFSLVALSTQQPPRKTALLQKIRAHSTPPPQSSRTMDDVHMETPPVSSANDKDPMASQQSQDNGSSPQQDGSVRALLGSSVVEDFGHYRDILEQHVCLDTVGVIA